MLPNLHRLRVPSHVGLFAAAVMLALVATAPARAGAKTLIDFGDIRQDTNPDGNVTVIRVYDHVWGDWGNGVFDLRHKGTLIRCSKNSGSLGENGTAIKFAGTPAARLEYIVGPKNQANRIALKLTDADGTEAEWNVPLQDTKPGMLAAFRIDFAHPENVKGGKTPGLDIKHIANWDVTGDWSDKPVEVLLVKLIAAQ